MEKKPIALSYPLGKFRFIKTSCEAQYLPCSIFESHFVLVSYGRRAEKAKFHFKLGNLYMQTAYHDH
jgi:hypothetical protein